MNYQKSTQRQNRTRKRLNQVLFRLRNPLPKLDGPRYFGIGLNKTGTSTLGACFKHLDLTPVAHPESRHLSASILAECILYLGYYKPALRAAARFRSFEDRPWNIWKMYQHLDNHFPESHFILTVRDPETWWRSVNRWLTVTHKSKRRKHNSYLKHLKVDELDRDLFVSAYNEYNREVTAYFAGSHKFLTIDFEKGDGWTELCDFLHMPVPDIPLPHRNRQNYES